MIATLWLAGAAAARPGGAGYAGSRVCAGCHRDLYESYRKTGMGRSISVANAGALPPPTGTVFVSKWNRYFRVFRDGDRLYQSEWETTAAGEVVFKTTHRLEYAIGSGANGFTAVVRRGNYLFEAPLSYYSRTKKWDLSPGYEGNDAGFSRAILPACIACHSGRSSAVAGRQGLYREPVFEGMAIGCENCHGPGGSHAAKPGATNIVNPRRLAARLAEEICMNCHQTGDAKILQPGRSYADFRPGSWLNETVAIFKIPARNRLETSDLLEHHENMKASRCYQASDGKLSCLTCHDPHVRPDRAAAWFRAKCLRCHQDSSCRLPATDRARNADDCAACHMPKRDVGVISHSMLTNHRIAAIPGKSAPPAAPSSSDLIHVNPAPGKAGTLAPLTWLRAYGGAMAIEPSYQERYLALLEQLGRETPEDSFVQAALGRKELGEGRSNASAIEHLSKAIELGFTGPAAYEDLAEALSRAGRLEEAVAVLKRGIGLEPYTPELYKSLALRYISLKQYVPARQTMERYVELFPEDSFMRRLLAKVSETSPTSPRLP